VLQQVRYIKEPSLLKAVSAKHRSKFAALSPAMVTNSRQIAEKMLVLLKTMKHTNKNKTFLTDFQHCDPTETYAFLSFHL
jgi:hypothetical protein